MRTSRCSRSSNVATILAAVLPAASNAFEHVAYWINPSATVVQSLVCISGGDQYVGNFTDNAWGSAPRNTPIGGSVYTISLCDSFKTTPDVDLDDVWTHWGNLTADNQYPNYVGGAMFTNDYEFYTYGGMSLPSVTGSGVTRGDMYQHIPLQKWNRGITFDWDAANLSDTARLYTHGSWASAPSENLAFWFGGMRAADNEPVNYVATEGDSDQANTSATVFIEFDLSVNTMATSRNLSWPNGVEPRAEGALVWLPYSEKGILLAFGGIQIPADMMVSGIFPNETYNAQSFMTSVLVYDIASEQWSAQETISSPNPAQLASFCTVVADAPDGKSHHIYVYGGYDGTYGTTDAMQASDEIWVLSIPAFHWTKLSEGIVDHQRQNHVCVKITPSQMLSIGGSTAFGQPLTAPSALDVLDPNTGKWTQKYDVNETEYKVPEAITNNIGDASKVPDDLVDDVKSWVSRAYNQEIRTFTHNCSTGSGSPDTPTAEHNDDDTPSWQTPVIAAVAAVVGVAIIVTAVWCMCFRNRKGHSESDKRNSWISNWVHKTGQHSGQKSEPDSENTVIASPTGFYGAKEANTDTYEMASDVASPRLSAYGYGHGPPQLVQTSSATSPQFGPAEADPQSRHEIMDSAPRDSTSIRQHPLYPRSLSGDHIRSMKSDTMSHMSETLMPPRHYGHISPYELPHDRSNENLPHPPTDLSLDNQQNGVYRNSASPSSGGMTGNYVQSPTAMTPAAGGPLNTAGSPDMDDNERPSHRRNQSSMSSNLPNLPSPGVDEDWRQSRYIESLPDSASRQTSPVQSQAPRSSTYREHFDLNE